MILVKFNTFWEELISTFSDLITINGLNQNYCLPNTVSVSFKNSLFKGYLILNLTKTVKAKNCAICHFQSFIKTIPKVLIASEIKSHLAHCIL